MSADTRTLHIVAKDHGSLSMHSSAFDALETYARAVKKHKGHVVMFEIQVEGFDKMVAYNLAYAKMKTGDYVAIAERHAEPDSS